MRIKNLLPLLLAGSLMIACTPAKQAGNSFEWVAKWTVCLKGK